MVGFRKLGNLENCSAPKAPSNFAEVVDGRRLRFSSSYRMRFQRWFRNPINSRPCLLDAYVHTATPQDTASDPHCRLRPSAVTTTRLREWVFLSQRFERNVTQASDVLIPPPNGVLFAESCTSNDRERDQRFILILSSGGGGGGRDPTSSLLFSPQRTGRRLGGNTWPPTTYLLVLGSAIRLEKGWNRTKQRL